MDFHTRPALTNGVSRQAPSQRLDSQAEQQKNYLSDVSTGLVDRPPAQLLSSVSGAAFPSSGFFHGIERDSDEKYVSMFDGSGAVRLFDSGGTEKSVHNGADVPAALSAATQAYLTTVGDAREQITATSIGDYTFIVNREKIVAMDASDVTPEQPNTALFWVKQAGNDIPYSIRMKHVWDGRWVYKDNNVEYPNLVAAPFYVGAVDSIIDVNLDTKMPSRVLEYTTSASGTHNAQEIAEELVTQLTAEQTRWADWRTRDVAYEASNGSFLFPQDGNSIETWTLNDGTGDSMGSVFWFSSTTAADDNVRFSVTDGLGNNGFKVAHGQVESLGDLPAQGAPTGFTIKVEGNDQSDIDDWYVTFDGNAWKETLGPGVTRSFDSATMPHVLIRQADGTFQCGPCDGLDGRPKWADRSVGDAKTNPDQGFVGKSIQGMSLYKSRLGFVYSDGIVFSEAGEFFNLFPTTVRQILTSDAMDIQVDAGSAAPLYRHAIPFDQVLLMWSETAQTVVAGTDLFAPDTVSANLATEFDVKLNIKPLATGQTFLYKAPGDRVWEYQSNPQGGSYGGVDITAHIPGYLPKDISWSVISRSSKIAVFGSPTNPSNLYVYRYFYDGTNKLQSSWSTWEFDPTLKIQGGHFFDNKLMLLTQLQGASFGSFPAFTPTVTYNNLIMEIDIDNPNQTGFDYPVLMDAINEVTVGVYTAAAGHACTPTYLTDPSLSSLKVVGSTNAGAWKGREIPIQAILAGVVYLAVELPAGSKVLIGFQYTREYEPTQFDLVTNIQTGLSRGTPEPVTNSRVQVRRVKVQLKNAGHLKATVTRNGTQVSEKIYTPVRVGDVAGEITPAASSEFEIDIGGNAKEVTLVLSNSSFLPCNLTGLSWEALYHNRSNPRRA
jgi:hypothetical protein